jgi:hypothetical protein
MLIRYPELSSLRLNPKAGTLSFTIFLNGEVSDEKRDEFAAYCADCFAACQALEPGFSVLGKIAQTGMEGVTILTYEQQVDVLNLTELSLFMQLVHEYYRGMLGEEAMPLHDAEHDAEEEIIARILGEKDALRQEETIVAYRDGGKVFVYNK